MKILALDLGIRTGFAFGAVGAVPSAGTVVLKAKDDHRSVAFGNLIAWLDARLRADRPDLVVREAPLNLQAFKHLGNAAFTVLVTHGLHGIVEGVCARFGVRGEDVADATVRKHFIGKANCGNRAATKAAVVQRCHLLGYMPKDCADDNRADALALFDWAAATFGNRRTESLHLFGEGARAQACQFASEHVLKSTIPKPAEGNDPGQNATGGVLIPTMAAEQPGEPEAGAIESGSASAPRSPYSLAPADPDAEEGERGDDRAPCPATIQPSLPSGGDRPRPVLTACQISPGGAAEDSKLELPPELRVGHPANKWLRPDHDTHPATGPP